jgi:tetratricopeptide (TPR) repeat protein
MVASAAATAVIVFILVHLTGRLGGMRAEWQRPEVTATDLPALPKFPIRSMEPTVRMQFSQALERLGEAPLDAEANGTLGMLYHTYGFFALAEPCYRRAAAFEPDEIRWRFYLGLVLAGRGDWDGAAAELARVLSVQPEHVPALLRRADADRRRNRFGAARAGYERVIELAPGTAQAHCGAGQVALRRDDLDAAVDHLREAIQLAPDYGTAHYALGQALRKIGRLDEAKAQLMLAEQHRDDEPSLEDPLAAELQQLRTGAVESLHHGVELAGRGRYDAAIELFQESVRIDPKLAEAHAQLGAALLARGDLEMAAPTLRGAIELDPNLADALYNLGLLEHRRGDFDRAVGHFRRAVDVRSDHFDAHLGLGTDLPHLGRRDEAIMHLRTALGLRPDNPRPYKRLGSALAQAGDCPGAVSVLRAGTLRLARDASIADRLAWLLATCSRPSPHDAEEALRIAEEVCRRTRLAEPRALSTKAAALAALGRFDEAVASAAEAGQLARGQGKVDLEQEFAIQLECYRAGRLYRTPAQPAGESLPPIH